MMKKYKTYTMQSVVFINIFGLLINNCICFRIGSNKYWLPNLEWSTRDNWINDNVPKTNGRVIFPLDMYHSVGLSSGNLTVSGIELSYNGSLVLPRNGILTMSNLKKNEDNIFKWKMRGLLLWMDPENWSASSNATPHFERIPCATDIVVLPDQNHTLSIKLPDNNVEVLGIKRGNDEILDEWSWQSLINGRDFRYSRMSVRYSGLQYCEDCLCKPDNIEELVAEVCSIQSSRCGSRRCEYPLKIEGHCCDYCGGRISVTAESASVSMLTQLTNEALENFHEGVSWHVRRSWNGRDNQVLFTENDIYSGIKSQEAMDKLTEFLTVRGIMIIDCVNTGAPLTGSSLKNVLVPILGIPVFILLLILASFPYFGYPYTRVLMIWREAYGSVRNGISSDIPSQINESFSFARFENVTESRIHLAGTLITENTEDYRRHNNDTNDDDDDDSDGNDDDIAGSSSKRFENPLYGSKSKITALAKANKEKIIDIDTAISLNALKKSAIYSSDETNITDDD